MDKEVNNEAVVDTIVEALLMVQAGESLTGFRKPIQIRLTKTVLSCVGEEGINNFPFISGDALKQVVTTWHTFLRENEREVLHMKIYCEYPIEEIARRMGGLKKQRVHAILKNTGRKLNGTLQNIYAKLPSKAPLK